MVMARYVKFGIVKGLRSFVEIKKAAKTLPTKFQLK